MLETCDDCASETGYRRKALLNGPGDRPRLRGAAGRGLEKMMDPETASGAHDRAPETDTLGQAPALHAGPKDRFTAGRAPRPPKSPALHELPPPGVVRWVIRRKAQVVAAVQAGIITVEEVNERYSVSPEEFESWKRLFERHGVYGLRSTRSQLYRTGPTDKG